MKDNTSTLDSFSGSTLVWESWTITPSTQAQKSRSAWQTLAVKGREKRVKPLGGLISITSPEMDWADGTRDKFEHILEGSSGGGRHHVGGFLGELIEEEFHFGVFTVSHRPGLWGQKVETHTDADCSNTISSSQPEVSSSVKPRHLVVT